MTFNGVDLLVVIVAVVAVYLAAHLIVWRSRDRIRRLDRLAKRGLL